VINSGRQNVCSVKPSNRIRPFTPKTNADPRPWRASASTALPPIEDGKTERGAVAAYACFCPRQKRAMLKTGKRLAARRQIQHPPATLRSSPLSVLRPASSKKRSLAPVEINQLCRALVFYLFALPPLRLYDLYRPPFMRNHQRHGGSRLAWRVCPSSAPSSYAFEQLSWQPAGDGHGARVGNLYERRW